MTAATAVRERGITFSAPMIKALLREVDPKTHEIRARADAATEGPWKAEAERDEAKQALETGATCAAPIPAE